MYCWGVTENAALGPEAVGRLKMSVGKLEMVAQLTALVVGFAPAVAAMATSTSQNSQLLLTQIQKINQVNDWKG